MLGFVQFAALQIAIRNTSTVTTQANLANKIVKTGITRQALQVSIQAHEADSG